MSNSEGGEDGWLTASIQPRYLPDLNKYNKMEIELPEETSIDKIGDQHLSRLSSRSELTRLEKMAQRCCDDYGAAQRDWDEVKLRLTVRKPGQLMEEISAKSRPPCTPPLGVYLQEFRSVMTKDDVTCILHPTLDAIAAKVTAVSTRKVRNEVIEFHNAMLEESMHQASAAQSGESSTQQSAPAPERPEDFLCELMVDFLRAFASIDKTNLELTW